MARAQAQDPAAGQDDRRLAPSGAVRSGDLDRRDGPGRRSGEPSAAADVTIRPRIARRSGARKERDPVRREYHPRREDQARDAGRREAKSTPTGLEEDEVKLHLLQGGAKEVVDFKVKRASIKKIEYFEDMLLEECDRLVALHDYTRAFECCLRVETRNPGWNGLFDRVNRVLFAEGSKALIDGDGERGLRLLRELLGRKRDYPGLLDQIGEAYSKRIERAISLGPLPAGAARAARARRARARAYSGEADARSVHQQGDGPRQGVRVSAASRAARRARRGAAHLADARGSRAALQEGVQRRTDARSGGERRGFSAGPVGSHAGRPADQPAAVSRRSWSSDDDDARQGKKPGQLAAGIESSDLGRRLVLKIRPGFHWSDGSRPVSAIDVGRDLIDRTDPHSLRYDARWADLLDRVEVADEIAAGASAQPLAAQGRVMAAGAGRAGPCRLRRPGDVARALIARWSPTVFSDAPSPGRSGRAAAARRPRAASECRRRESRGPGVAAKLARRAGFREDARGRSRRQVGRSRLRPPRKWRSSAFARSVC